MRASKKFVQTPLVLATPTLYAIDFLSVNRILS